MMHRISSRVLCVGVALTFLTTVAQPLPVSAAQVVRKLSDAMPAFGDIDNGDLRRPAISPDGLHVVFVADQATDEARELWSVPIDGQSPPVRLSGPLPSGTGIEKFVIAPDSEHVVYRAAQDSAGVSELYSVPIAGGAINKLNGPLVVGGDVEDFQISPDGTRVVYKAAQATERGEIFSVAIGGGAEVRLSGTLVLGGNLFDFDITPDGNRVVYRADQQVDGLFELYSVPIGGGAFTKISNGAKVSDTVGITPDSERIVYQATFAISSVTELFSVPVSGGVAVQLNTPLVLGRVVSGAHLSPNGSRVVYVADELADDVFEMFSVPTTGGSRVKLNGALATGGDVVASTPTFSPDSAQVVYIADQLTNDVLELFSVPVGGGVNTKLNAPLAAARDVSTFGATIADGNRVIFTADQDTDDVFELYSVPLLGGATTKLNDPLVADGRIDSFKLSPDGDRVLYSASQNVVDRFELFSVPVLGGAVTAVSGVLTSGGSVEFGFVFSPDGQQVLYVADQDVDETSELYLSFDPTAPPPAVPPLIPLVPARFLDTRPGASTIDDQFEGIGRRDAGSTLELTIAGRGGLPIGPAAVVLNVTAVDASGSGFVTVYPCDAPRPLASSLNYTPGTTTPNEVIAKLSATGTICLFTLAEVHLIADVTGGVPKLSAYRPLVPARLLDTRPGETTIDHQFEGQGIRQAGSTLELPITGRGAVGGGAVAAVVNITAVNATAAGFVTVYPCDAPQPLASSLNYAPGETAANEVIAKLSPTGTICLFTLQSVDLVVDVTGALRSTPHYLPLVPARLLDTRPGETTIDHLFEGQGIRQAGSTLELTITGRGGVGAGAVAAVVNITAVNATAAGFVTVFPCDAPQPLASSLNYVPGTTTPNEVIAKLSATGTICLFTLQPVDLLVDVTGVVGS
jgi:Tol biopolymer transport system component